MKRWKSATVSFAILVAWIASQFFDFDIEALGLNNRLTGILELCGAAIGAAIPLISIYLLVIFVDWTKTELPKKAQ